MILFLVAIDPACQLREFSCHLPSLEVALKVLNSIASRDKLIQAKITDAGHSIHLPVDVFDGDCFDAPLLALETQWREVLRTTRETPISNEWLLDLTHQRLDSFNIVINRISLRIAQLERLRREVDDKIFIEPSKSKLTQYYQSQLSKYHGTLREVHKRKESALNRLHQLQLQEEKSQR
jgi:hypothetical protein